MSTLSEEMRN